jgi:predicted histidine transporter YuiF (NhaC family)
MAEGAGMSWSAWIVLAATVVNAIAVVVLVCVTSSYAKSSHRQAQAAESQAKASEAAARAATAQARAAQAQAAAATDTLITLRQQIYDQDVVAKNVVEVAIRSALNNIEFWQKYLTERFVLAVQTHAVATPVLTPANGAHVVDSAGRLSRELAMTLNGAFDILNTVSQRIDGLGHTNDKGLTYLDLPQEAKELGVLLSQARDTLQRSQTDLYQIPTKDKFTIQL